MVDIQSMPPSNYTKEQKNIINKYVQKRCTKCDSINSKDPQSYEVRLDHIRLFHLEVLEREEAAILGLTPNDQGRQNSATLLSS